MPEDDTTTTPPEGGQKGEKAPEEKGQPETTPSDSTLVDALRNRREAADSPTGDEAPRLEFKSYEDLVQKLPESARSLIDDQMRRNRDQGVTEYRKSLEKKGLLRDETDSEEGEDPSHQPGNRERGYLTREEAEELFAQREAQREAIRRKEEATARMLTGLCEEHGWDGPKQKQLLDFLEAQEKDPSSDFGVKDLTNRKGALAAARAAGLFEEATVEPQWGITAAQTELDGKPKEDPLLKNVQSRPDLDLQKRLQERAKQERW